MTVKELEAKVAALEEQVTLHAASIMKLGEQIVTLLRVIQAAAERPQRAAPAGPVAASKEARVAAIKRLAARHPDRRSFTPAEVNEELGNAA